MSFPNPAAVARLAVAIPVALSLLLAGAPFAAGLAAIAFAVVSMTLLVARLGIVRLGIPPSVVDQLSCSRASSSSGRRWWG